MNEIELIREKINSINSIKNEDAILLINYNNLGDLICDTPSLRNIRKSYPKDKIILLVRNQTCINLMNNCPYVDQVLEMPHSKDSIDVYYDFCLKLNKYNFKFSIQFVRPFNELYRTYLPYMLGIKKRLGLIQKEYEEKYKKAFTDYYFLENNTTRTQESLELLKLLNIKIDNSKTECFINEKNITHFKHKNYIIIQTCATMECRMWHRNNFIELINKITKKYPDIDILLTGSKNEDDYINNIYLEVNNKRVYKYTDINIDTLLNYIKNAKLVITNDTGPYHFARAFDTKRVVIFGISPRNYLIKEKEKNSIELCGNNRCPANCKIKSIDKDCIKKYKVYGDNYNCINTVSVEDVLNASIKILEEK